MIAQLFRNLVTLDARSLALARIAAGLIIIGDLISRSFEMTLHYTSQGVLPLYVMRAMQGPHFPGFYLLGDSLAFMACAFLFHAFVATLLILGYRTRMTTIACWYLGHSLMTRNFMVNNGGDSVLVCILFWSIFVPWGRCWSLDSLARPLGSAGSEPPDPVPPTDYAVRSAGTACWVGQLFLIYWSSVYHKLEPSWLNGEAIYFAFNSELYSRPLSKLLLPYPALLTLSTYSVLCWEALGPALLLSGRRQVRLFVCAGFFMLHMAFGTFLRVGIFMWTPCLFYLALLPEGLWRGRSNPLPAHWVRRLRRLALALRARPSSDYALGKNTAWVLSFLFLASFFSAMENHVLKTRVLPHEFNWVPLYTGLTQRWSVFIRLPDNADSWMQMPALLSDGSTVDIFHDRDPLTWDKPKVVSEAHGHFRWPTPVTVAAGQPGMRPAFVRAFRLRWDRLHPDRKVRSVRLVMFAEPTLREYRDVNPVPADLYLWPPTEAAKR